MTFTSILALAIGLSMDAAAVSVARGAASCSTFPALRLRHFVIVGAFFGGFQAVMPLVGWLLGSRFGPMVAAWDHWIAFVLLGGIGLKMLYESRKMEEPDVDPDEADGNLFGLRVMFILAVATSIDALAAGFTLPMLDASLVTSLLTIGVTTALLSMAGLGVGRRFGAMIGKRLDAFGGVVLVLLGTKILVEHLSAG